MLKISPNSLEIGAIFFHQGFVYQILDKWHVKLSKGGACIKIKCLNLNTKAILDEMRINVNDRVERLYSEKLILDYEYSDGQIAYFRDNEETSASRGLAFEFKIEDLGELGVIFSSRSKVTSIPQVEITLVKYTENNSNEELIKILNIRLLSDLAVRVKDTRPTIKGQTAKANLKEAETYAGFKVWVPQYIKNEDLILVQFDGIEYKFAGKSDDRN